MAAVEQKGRPNKTAIKSSLKAGMQTLKRLMSQPASSGATT